MKSDTLPDYFHEFEGELFDTRWTAQRVRANYAKHHREIKTARDLVSCLRAGDYAWPGGYAIFYVTSDGAVLCPKCVREELANIVDSIRNDYGDGWRVVGLDAECNCDENPVCDHCNEEVG